MKLTDLGEKALVKRLASFLDIGDDAAHIKYGDGYLVMTTDMIYEDTHRLPTMTYEQLGKFIVSVNASDVASMGAKPLAFLLAYGSPDIEVSDFDALMHAVEERCNEYGMKYAGGDTKQMAKLTLAGFCVGTTEKPLLRSGAKKGDLIAVTGTLGDAALGIKVLFSGNKALFGSPVVKKALEPQARIKEGLVIGQYASAGTDTSDSLASSLHDISEMSRVGIRIFADQLPVSDAAKTLAKQADLNLMEYALYGGGDYELVFTASREAFYQMEGRLDLTVIGEVTDQGVTGIKGEEEFSIPRRGYEHFLKKR